MALTKENKAGNYFDREADRFDAIYRDDKPALARLGDHLFRQVIRERYDLIVRRCQKRGAQSVVDIGCGSGRYANRLHAAGIDYALGIDVAPQMIDLAEKYAAALGGSGSVEYRVADFMELSLDHKFDAALAVGYFDYMSQPAEHLVKIRNYLSENGEMAASFPKLYTLRTPIRWARLNLSGCPVYFYTEPQVRKLLAETGFTNIEIVNLSRDYIVFAS